MEPHRILVTGGLGLIGHNIVARLEQQGHVVVITDTCTTYGIISQNEIDYLVGERRKRIRDEYFHRVDVADAEGVDWLMKHYKIDTVIHTASFPRQKVVNANPAVGSRVMSEGLLNLLEAAKHYSVQRFVYLSSSMVYGDFADGVREHHDCRPQGQYGIMKLAGEWLVRDYTRSCGLPHTIIRPSAVYGPLDVEDRVVSRFLLTAMRGGVLRVNGPAEALDFTYVDDVAQGIALAALSDRATNKTYNITRGHSRSLLEAAQLAVKIAGQGTIEVGTRDQNFPSRGALNIDAARTDFDFFPTVDIEEGFQAYHEWLTDSVYWSKKTV